MSTSLRPPARWLAPGVAVVAALAAGWLGRWMGAVVTPTAQHV